MPRSQAVIVHEYSRCASCLEKSENTVQFDAPITGGKVRLCELCVLDLGSMFAEHADGFEPDAEPEMEPEPEGEGDLS